jgi:hypothetical protein
MLYCVVGACWALIVPAYLVRRKKDEGGGGGDEKKVGYVGFYMATWSSGSDVNIFF